MLGCFAKWLGGRLCFHDIIYINHSCFNGIAIHYMAFPRAGVGSASFEKYVSVWCADDQQAAMTLAEQNDLIVTLPTRAAQLKRDNPRVVLREPPLEIPPLELKMAWSPLLQHNPANRWLRKLITDTARELDGQEPTPD